MSRAPGGSLLAAAWGGDRPAWILCLAFAAMGASLLPSLDYNFDEGVYIQQALLIVGGQLPYADFFYHQTPLYPFTLAAVGRAAPDALLAYRLPSLVATALCGVLVYRIGLRLLPRGAALAAMLIFYGAPLQFFGLVALPNALMGFVATAGVALLWFRPASGAAAEWGASLSGGALVGLSLLLKPLTLPLAIALGLALLASRERRLRSVGYVLGGGAVGLCAWAGFHAATEGRFTQLLELQLSRYAGRSGFEVMLGFEPFRQLVERFGLDTPTAWNVHEHRRALLVPSPHANLHVAVLAAAGQLLLLSRWGRRFAGHRLFLTLWWGLPLAFSIWLWEPSWDHYFVQYLPPFAILGATFLEGLWSLPRGRPVARAAVGLMVALAVGLGPYHLAARRRDYGALATPAAPGESWLLFDPFLNFVSRTRPACGVIDPFNVYGERSLIRLSPHAVWRRHHVSEADLIACLERDPTIRIGSGGEWSPWFVDGELAAFLEGLPRDRFFVLWARP